MFKILMGIVVLAALCGIYLDISKTVKPAKQTIVLKKSHEYLITIKEPLHSRLDRDTEWIPTEITDVPAGVKLTFSKGTPRSFYPAFFIRNDDGTMLSVKYSRAEDNSFLIPQKFKNGVLVSKDHSMVLIKREQPI